MTFASKFLVILTTISSKIGELCRFRHLYTSEFNESDNHGKRFPSLHVTTLKTITTAFDTR